MTVILVMLHGDKAAALERLPVEILAKIFYIYVADTRQLEDKDSDAFPHSSGPLQPWSWITISHICQRWRDIVLHSPYFWTVISPTHPEAVQHAIAHSAQLPLTVLHSRRDLSHHNDPAHVTCYIAAHRAIFAQLPRIRIAELTITSAINELLTSPEFAASEAPLLEKLQLKLLEDRVPVFLNVALPRLTDFAVHSFEKHATWHFLLPPLAGPALTSLNLSSHDLLTLAALAKLLGGFPSLTRLSLYDVGLEPDIPDDPLAPLTIDTETVALQSLAFLWLEDTREGIACAGLLEYITFPLATSIHFVLHRKYLYYPDILVASMVRKVVAAQAGASAFRAKSVSIMTDDSGEQLAIALWATRQCFYADGAETTEDSSSFSFSLKYTDDDFTTGIVHDFFKEVDLSGVETVRVANAIIGPVVWERLASTDRLEQLMISECAIDDFLEIDASLLSPTLKVLELHNTRLVRRGWPRVLQNILLAHAERDGKLRILKVSHALNISTEYAETLSGFAEHFYVESGDVFRAA